MNNLPKIYRVLAVVFVVALVVLVASIVLMSDFAGPAVQKGAGYTMLAANVVMIACVLALFAQRFRPEAREPQRQLARREGRTVWFYVGSIAVLLASTAVALAILTYVLEGTRYMKFALAAAPLVVGLSYQQWYQRYRRRSAERYDTENDTFS